MLLLLVFMVGCQPTDLLNNLNPGPAAPETEQASFRDINVILTEAYPQLSFRQPLEYCQAGDNSDRVFVVEKGGRILVFPNDPQVQAARVFLDLTGLVDSGASEKGLLGLAFHPQYQSNGFFTLTIRIKTAPS